MLRKWLYFEMYSYFYRRMRENKTTLKRTERKTVDVGNLICKITSRDLIQGKVEDFTAKMIINKVYQYNMHSCWKELSSIVLKKQNIKKLKCCFQTLNDF